MAMEGDEEPAAEGEDEKDVEKDGEGQEDGRGG